MQRRLLQSFTYILEWGRGTCTLTKHTRRWTYPALRHFCFQCIQCGPSEVCCGKSTPSSSDPFVGSGSSPSLAQSPSNRLEISSSQKPSVKKVGNVS